MESLRTEKRMMDLSLVVAAVLMVAKIVAAFFTGSSAVYSDAAESVVHLLAVAFAAWAVRMSHKPADETHHFGHDKIAFLSSGFEGAMISAAAILILYQSGHQFVFGVAISNLFLGTIVTATAAGINLLLGLCLLSVGATTRSPVLRANGLHVLTDVWSSAAVLLALALIRVTGWTWWDPIAASIAALNILRVGIGLMRESLRGLLDESDPKIERQICDLLDKECATRGLSYHNLRHRHSGRTHWVEVHLVFDDDMTVGAAHDAATAIEAEIAGLLHPHGRVISHLEPKSAEHAEEKWEER